MLITDYRYNQGALSAVSMSMSAENKNSTNRTWTK